MQDNSNQNQTQPTASQPFASSTGLIDTPMPQNDLNKLMSTQEPVTTPVTPSVPSIPVEAPIQPDLTSRAAQDVSQPIIPPTAPAVQEFQQQLPQELPQQEVNVGQELMAEKVDVATDQTTVIPEATTQQGDLSNADISSSSGINSGNLNVVDMMVAKPSTPEQPKQQPEPATVEPTIPQQEFQPVTPTAEAASSTTKAENLNILSDIIPTPMAENPISSLSESANRPVGPSFGESGSQPDQSVPFSVAPEGQLSQVFELAPSEVVIPSNSEPVMIQPEPAMVPVDTNSTIALNSVGAVGAATPVSTSAVINPNDDATKKSGMFGGFLRYAIWIFILLLGVVAIFLGVYLAGLIEIPFLDSIFGR